MLEKRRKGAAPTAPASGSSFDRRARLEIQIHPAEIDRRVRYLFLSRRAVWGWAGGLALYLAFLGMGVAFTPRVVGGLLGVREYRSLLAERDQQGRRLRALNQQLREIEGRTEGLRLEVRRILWAYGLSDEDSIGQGGYPEHSARETIAGRKVQFRGHIGREVELGERLSTQISDSHRVLQVFLDEVQELEKARSDQVRYTPSIKPLPAASFVLTSPFSQRVSPFTSNREFHAGLDLAALAGTPIHATADGVVVFAGRFPRHQSVGWWRYGNLVVLRHGESFITLYGHCDEIRVRQHQQVERGEVVATVGNTGWSTSSHLHYEVRRRDEEGDFRPRDPRIYILDHRWNDQERLLVRARKAPPLENYEPLPRLLAR